MQKKQDPDPEPIRICNPVYGSKDPDPYLYENSRIRNNGLTIRIQKVQ